jgi:hypothetical protein
MLILYYILCIFCVYTIMTLKSLQYFCFYIGSYLLGATNLLKFNLIYEDWSEPSGKSKLISPGLLLCRMGPTTGFSWVSGSGKISNFWHCLINYLILSSAGLYGSLDTARPCDNTGGEGGGTVLQNVRFSP